MSREPREILADIKASAQYRAPDLAKTVIEILDILSMLSNGVAENCQRIEALEAQLKAAQAQNKP